MDEFYPLSFSLSLGLGLSIYLSSSHRRHLEPVSLLFYLFIYLLLYFLQDKNINPNSIATMQLHNVCSILALLAAGVFALPAPVNPSEIQASSAADTAKPKPQTERVWMDEPEAAQYLSDPRWKLVKKKYSCGYCDSSSSKVDKINKHRDEVHGTRQAQVDHTIYPGETRLTFERVSGYP